jgi:hypothetical protein
MGREDIENMDEKESINSIQDIDKSNTITIEDIDNE